MGMPIVHGVYYDRWKKVLKCDPDLLKVVVNPEWTLQECIEEADTHYGERFFELEKKGENQIHRYIFRFYFSIVSECKVYH